jgi:pimeloyl-ACP methyl ester carboxylesterase
LLGDALAHTLARAGTRAAPDGFTWKHDPLHATMGPYPYRLDHASQYWRRVMCPVLVVDGARSVLNLSEAERAARRACFAGARHHVLADAGHMMQRHRPQELARLLATLA